MIVLSLVSAYLKISYFLFLDKDRLFSFISLECGEASFFILFAVDSI